MTESSGLLQNDARDTGHLALSIEHFSPRALANLTVIALEQAVAAPFCTRQLADLGADVIKIERPDGGDFARNYDGDMRGISGHFVWLNRGKRSVTLDLKSRCRARSIALDSWLAPTSSSTTSALAQSSASASATTTSVKSTRA
ncbi:MAG: CoA transferase [Thermomicrobiales bacterium]